MNRILDERDKVKLESSINATQESINNQIANLKGYADDNMEQLSEKVDGVNDRANNRISELQRKITTDIAALNLQTNTKINNLNNSLTNQINELDEEMSSNIGALESNMNKKDNELSTQIDTLEEDTSTKINTLRSDVDTEIANLNESVNTQISYLDSNLTTSINELGEDLSSQITTLDDDIDALDRKISTVSSVLSNEYNNLNQFVGTLDVNKVDKVEGKALSENDLTDELKENYDDSYEHSLLAHAPSDAEINVQANWTEEDNTSDAYIQNKPVLGSMAAKNIVAKSDLSDEVKTSLELADTSLQSYTETDPTVPEWAKQPEKPTYTAAEIGALPISALPVITEEDEGKVLCVVNGHYSLVSITDLISNE